MLVLGILIFLLGGGLALHGLNVNQSLAAQLASAFEKGTLNPGTTWLIIGAVVAVLGIAVIVFAVIKKKYFKF